MWHFNKNNPSKSENHKIQKFDGNRYDVIDKLPVDKLPESILLVGYLEELECETPLEDKVDIMSLIVNKSKKKCLVCASGDGKLVMIVSPDKLSENPDEKPADLKKTVSLHEDFHGTGAKEIKKVDVAPVDTLVFFGWLNYIVYDVPNYSERRGVPFIHEAKDRGDDVAPSKEKPIVCVSPKKDMIIMYGKEFEFTDRGIIG